MFRFLSVLFSMAIYLYAILLYKTSEYLISRNKKMKQPVKFEALYWEIAADLAEKLLTQPLLVIVGRKPGASCTTNRKR